MIGFLLIVSNTWLYVVFGFRLVVPWWVEVATGRLAVEDEERCRQTELVGRPNTAAHDVRARGDRVSRRDAIETRYGAAGWGVVTVEVNRGHQTAPCARCPWRKDAKIGRFPAEVFRLSARTTYDMADTTFGCHMSPMDRALTCAGFLLRGAADNLIVRLRAGQYGDVHSDVELYGSYREMAIANGVDADDPVLEPCRGEGSWLAGEAR